MIRVSASAFDVLWSDLGHAAPPWPLSVRSVGVTEAERAEIRDAVYENLAERGLYDGDRLDAALEARLDLLARAEVYVECEALADMTAQAPFRAVAAARGRHGVLATQPEQTIALSGIGDGEVFAAIVDVLPELRPGPGYGISLPAARFGDALEDPVFGDGGRSSASDSQLREVLAIQARPVYSAGQFTVRTRDRDGRAHRAGGLTWFDTDVGAYCAARTEGRGGQAWVNVSPVDGPRLAARLASLLDPDR
ncbi:ESX secretion-associated protein EspG [Amycolatopsis keratiniphila]|uniref:ESX secretion-associated protein EspG n=1 Tax=Amycolatopsis keratiniphila subsp. keratiniphila TaxID=227715 RepID=A0A1W2LXB5_9PSEU|nr:ESX secretion-associated protein EspG [Amycolatopsis keratiniphila]ONF71489.1 ESX secretion-associated protein EspG [Amycolatopsis keratiniphila subsp. keratiniphila]